MKISASSFKKSLWRCKTGCLLALFCGLATASAQAQDNGPKTLSTGEIVDKALRVNYYQGQDGRSAIDMSILDKQGRERHRSLIILRRDVIQDKDPQDLFLGDQKFYVYFRRPADVRQMAFMVWKHTDSDDDRWLYLPDLDLVKRIASSEERTSFVGSHFFYEDVSGRNKNEDTHTLLETTDNYYVLKGTPKKPKDVDFAYYKMWIHRDSFVVTQTRYYDQSDQSYREYKALQVEHIQGYPTVTKARMSDTRLGGETVLTYSDVRYNVGLPDDIFTERYLRRPPLRYLR